MIQNNVFDDVLSSMNIHDRLYSLSMHPAIFGRAFELGIPRSAWDHKGHQWPNQAALISSATSPAPETYSVSAFALMTPGLVTALHHGLLFMERVHHWRSRHTRHLSTRVVAGMQMQNC